MPYLKVPPWGTNSWLNITVGLQRHEAISYKCVQKILTSQTLQNVQQRKKTKELKRWNVASQMAKSQNRSVWFVAMCWRRRALNLPRLEGFCRLNIKSCRKKVFYCYYKSHSVRNQSCRETQWNSESGTPNMTCSEWRFHFSNHARDGVSYAKSAADHLALLKESNDTVANKTEHGNRRERVPKINLSVNNHVIIICPCKAEEESGSEISVSKEGQQYESLIDALGDTALKKRFWRSYWLKVGHQCKVNTEDRVTLL